MKVDIPSSKYSTKIGIRLDELHKLEIYIVFEDLVS